VIRFGIGGTGMPGNWMITEREATQIAHYVQSLGKNAEEVILGDPVAGRTVFEKGYCAGCHIIQGAGRGLGPELSSVGTRRGAEYLRTIIRHPAGNSAKNLRGYKTFLIVQVETSDGNTVRGIRINEDTFTIQIRDKGGAYHSFRKRDVKNVSRAVDESLMPAYEKTFSPAEIDDLVAYLASLRGKK
jgi:putative heme-binding domain-containing protein